MDNFMQGLSQYNESAPIFRIAVGQLQGESMDDKNSRRDFVRVSGTAAAAGAGLLILKPETVRGSQANSALTVGLIGAGRRGTYVSGIFAKNEFARMAALCDIYDDQLK